MKATGRVNRPRAGARRRRARGRRRSRTATGTRAGCPGREAEQLLRAVLEEDQRGDDAQDAEDAGRPDGLEVVGAHGVLSPDNTGQACKRSTEPQRPAFGVTWRRGSGSKRNTGGALYLSSVRTCGPLPGRRRALAARSGSPEDGRRCTHGSPSRSGQGEGRTGGRKPGSGEDRHATQVGQPVPDLVHVEPPRHQALLGA